MKKIINGVLFFVFVLSLKPAFSQAFDDGTNLVNLGFGLPPTKRISDIYSKYNDFEERHIRNYGTVVLKYEHGLHKNFGLGLNLEYSASSLTYKYFDNLTTHNLVYSANVKSSLYGAYIRLNAHLPIDDKFDFYAGAGLGYQYFVDVHAITDEKNAAASEERKNTDLEFDYQFTLGLRYMIKESTGIFFEIGRATTIAQLGIAIKF